MKKILKFVLPLMACVAVTACSGTATTETTTVATTASVEETTTAEEAAETTEAEKVESEESDSAYVKEKGNMVIGYTVYEPMNYTDEAGDLTGFDTELAIIVCEKLGVDPEFVVINWDTKEVELAGKSIDVIWNGLTLTPEREANMACTNPYVKNAQVIVTDSEFEYTDTSSLVGKTVVAEIGSAGEEQVKGEEADENLAQSDYIGKGVQVDCLLEVKAGTADAAILDLTLAKAMTGEGTDYADLTIVDSLAEEFYGVAFRQGSDLRDEVNVIFDELYEDGTLETLAEKYNLDLAK